MTADSAQVSRPLLAACAAALLVFAGCSHETSRTEFRYVAPSETEAEAFGRSVDEALAARDAERLSHLIAWDAIIEKATDDVDASPEFRSSFADGMKKGAASAQFARQLVTMIERGGSVDRLRICTRNGERRLILRLLQADGGVNYHELTLHRTESSMVQATDIYIYTTAEQLSDSFRRAYAMSAAEQKPQQLAAHLFSGSSSGLTRHDFLRFKELGEAARKGDHDRVLQLYSQLPERVRGEKMAMVLYVNAASQKRDDVYEKALAEFRAAYPDEHGLDLVMVDTYVRRKQFAQALGAVDRVERAVEGDPYLDSLRASIHLAAGDRAAARASASRAIQREATLIEPYWTLITISLAEHDYAETARLLTAVRDELGVPLGDLTTLPDYAGFVAAPEYRAFMQSAKGRPAAE